ncbi:hypothetical protein EC844_10845 [Acinetobacter calcoaceticus]|uniref:Uncharacterized protein n=1 Tax=Acinetobacter calcoaceticus TaxID=471 RepID=A0A4R1XWJ1_ACICA|nr:hypothetical protein EC844_10845 [Acinetobacter calcoaceticus]
MATQEKYSGCKQCEQKLQLEVKYCPFCGASQTAAQPRAVPVAGNSHPSNRHPSSNNPSSNNPSSSHSSNNNPSNSNPQVSSQNKNNALPEQNPALVIHLSKKTNKEIRGVVVVGRSLDELRLHDKYAFKKFNGVFVRLRDLKTVPNIWLNADQIKLKNQSHLTGYPNDYTQAVNQSAPVASTPLADPFSQQPQAAPLPDPLSQQPQSTPLPDPFGQQPQRQPLPSVPFKPLKADTSKFKFIAFFILIIGLIYFNGQRNKNAGTTSQDAASKLSPCESINAEISQFLSESRPRRALSISRQDKKLCKDNQEFTKLMSLADTQISSADMKMFQAKKLLRSGELEQAHETVNAALALDVEVPGAEKILQSIQDAAEQKINNQIEAPMPNSELPVATASPANAAVAEAEKQASQRQIQAELDLLKVQQADKERLKAAESARKQAEQVAKERQKAAELQRKQAAEAARKQHEEKFDNQLSRAERALKSNNYGLAKSLAREVLSQSSSNAQAKRILRQAEQGEAKAFDDMVIE